jgi:branched-chain amino acid transport system permease protein
VLVQLIINGIAMGGVYGIVALGFTMMWNASGLLNFAQGDLVMVGAYLGLSLLAVFKLPYPLAFVGAIVFTAILGVLIERVAWRPIRGSSPMIMLLSTIGVSIVLSNIVRVVWGTYPMPFPDIFGVETLDFLGTFIPTQYIFIVVVLALLMLLQYWFFAYTVTGKAMTAVAYDREMTSLLGINVNRMVSYTFAYGAGLCAIAGILIAPIYLVSLSISEVLIKGFAATILGGFGSVRGCLIGGILFGLVEIFGASLISASYTDAISFVVVIAVLLLRPQGIFGGTLTERT